MLRFIAILLLCLPLAASAEFPRAQDSFAVQRYQIACRLMEVQKECREFGVPTILAVPTSPGILGFYFPFTNIVFVSDRCLLDVADQHKCDAVVVHEIAHYIFDSMGKRALDPTGCQSEGVAWDVYNAYVLMIGRADLVRTNWTESYPLCAKSQSSSTSSGTQ